MISTVIVAFSMFSAIPMPQTEWTNKSMRYALCAFPLIGAVIGAAGVPVAFCVPADGVFGMDTGGGNLCTSGTCDRRHSSGRLLRYGRCAGKSSGYRKKTTDFKGPAYGRVRGDLAGLLFYRPACSCSDGSTNAGRSDGAGVWLLYQQKPFRACSCELSSCENSGLAYTFAEYADKKKVRTFLAVLAAVLCVLCCICCGKKGIGVSIAAIGTFLYYRFRLIGKFGGLSGDLAGWFVQMCELFMLAAVVLTEYL